MKYWFSILLLTIVLVSCEDDDKLEDTPSEPQLRFHLDMFNSIALTRSELKNGVNYDTIQIYDWVHGKKKNYKAFPLTSLLEYGFGSSTYNMALAGNSRFTFLALDGFSDTANVSQIQTNTGYVAFEDLDVEGEDNWELVAQENNNTPYPFYVVWSDSASQNPVSDDYPWPYQLSNIEIGN